MKHRPTVVAFDVLETLFPLDPLKSRLKDAGLPADALQLWYARTLRDGLALDMTGQFKSYRDVAQATLEGLLAEHSKQPGEERVREILDAMGELPPHPDVHPTLELLRSASVKAIALTNGSTKNTEKLLRHAGLDHLVAAIVSIDDVQRWKPARAVYLQGATAAGVETSQLALVAAHAWDVQGAHQAGLTTGWLPRTERRFPSLMQKPDVKGGTLLEVVQRLLELPLAG